MRISGIRGYFESQQNEIFQIMTENIGYKLKRLREDNQFSVEDLAVQSGVQQSQIEQIETGKMLPSLATLIKLSRTLGIRLGTFLDGMECPEPTLTHREQQTPQLSVHLSKGNGSDIEHLKYRSLAENKTDRNMEPFIINVEYTDPDEMSALSHHEGEEFIYVLDGSVEVRYGSDKYVVNKGKASISIRSFLTIFQCRRPVKKPKSWRWFTRLFKRLDFVENGKTRIDRLYRRGHS